ncbi:aldo/keto reductase [Sphaerisporangium melleum]|uniref:Aldo/keto reductase n=1 Tax=Sphaerisporangium melleum TaxID=321316 RepID=A0A917RCA3_9ACTN|nr:aldo/keto reductase [Sphaerisporangium melleum]GGL00934.1 aldo/keto reductase [Sphaerisporangium melleum]GII71623.1 aldo/keto reductase [Sphaerisporangium melleum]
MKYRPLGRTGVYVSELCLGTMSFGGPDHPVWGAVGGLGLQDSDRLVGAALDAGINFIDTANVYADGESEALLGQVLKDRRDDVVLATKVSARMGAGANDAGLSRLHVMRALEDSLRRLRTDHIDLYQIHNIDRYTPLEETLRALDDAVRQGKIRYIGCSNLAAWQVVKALGHSAAHNLAPFVSVQSYYSLATRDIEHELVPMLQDEGLGLMVWSPLAGGFLSGKFDRHGASDADSRRAKTEIDFPLIDKEKGYDVIDVLREVAGRHGVSAARVALAWVLGRPGVTSVIIGAKRPDQLADNLAAAELTLTDQDLAELDAVSADRVPHYPGWIHRFGEHGRLPEPV